MPRKPATRRTTGPTTWPGSARAGIGPASVLATARGVRRASRNASILVLGGGVMGVPAEDPHTLGLDGFTPDAVQAAAVAEAALIARACTRRAADRPSGPRHEPPPRQRADLALSNVASRGKPRPRAGPDPGGQGFSGGSASTRRATCSPRRAAHAARAGSSLGQHVEGSSSPMRWRISGCRRKGGSGSTSAPPRGGGFTDVLLKGGAARVLPSMSAMGSSRLGAAPRPARGGAGSTQCPPPDGGTRAEHPGAIVCDAYLHRAAHRVAGGARLGRAGRLGGRADQAAVRGRARARRPRAEWCATRRSTRRSAPPSARWWEALSGWRVMGIEHEPDHGPRGQTGIPDRGDQKGREGPRPRMARLISASSAQHGPRRPAPRDR